MLNLANPSVRKVSYAIFCIETIPIISLSIDLNNASEQEAQTLTNTDEIALLGKPKLGELYKCTVRIKESKEFKVSTDNLEHANSPLINCLFVNLQNMVDKLISKANTTIKIGSSSWKDQFVEAITVSAGRPDQINRIKSYSLNVLVLPFHFRRRR